MHNDFVIFRLIVKLDHPIGPYMCSLYSAFVCYCVISKQSISNNSIIRLDEWRSQNKTVGQWVRCFRIFLEDIQLSKQVAHQYSAALIPLAITNWHSPPHRRLQTQTAFHVHMITSTPASCVNGSVDDDGIVCMEGVTALPDSQKPL